MLYLRVREGRDVRRAMLHALFNFKLLPLLRVQTGISPILLPTSAWKCLEYLGTEGVPNFICDETLSCSDLTHIYKNILPSTLACLLALTTLANWLQHTHSKRSIKASCGIHITVSLPRDIAVIDCNQGSIVIEYKESK